MRPIRGREHERRKVIRPARRDALKKTAALAAAPLAFPAILRAQADVIRLGHLTPRTGFLGQVGEYGFRGASLAVEEANAAGGVLGRQIELIAEDSVNPATAVTKAQKLIERDQVVCLIGEVSSASALAIAQQALRYKIPFFNTGANSDALRGANCNRYMFHVEGSNTMYTKTIGTWQKEHDLIKGARWYFLTADYAFGQDLYRVSSKFLQDNGGVVLTNDMVPTNTADYSAYILKIRSLKPDFVYLNLAGVDQTTFLKQYKEYNLPYPLAGGVMDTVPFWAAGLENLSGHWQTLWYHGLKIPASQAFTSKFQQKFGTPPDNQAWGDYVGVRIVLQTIAATKSTDAQAIIQHLEKRRHLRHPEGAQGQLPQLGPPAPAGDVRRQGQGQGAVQGQVGHLRAGAHRAGAEGLAGADPADRGGESVQDGVR